MRQHLCNSPTRRAQQIRSFIFLLDSIDNAGAVKEGAMPSLLEVEQLGHRA